VDYNEYDDYGMDSAEGGKEYEAMVDTATALLIEEQRSCAAKTCWIGDQHDNECLPF